ncbi:major facilitator superfamily domain-containing protein [Apodospora peruviana]|uniref:Probable transporter MCH1 n=1 Tax=Apodospora peruviana TaxID=516989 RepID=A0AAE0HYK0_9PEZI|nr:major facilitator superfamily domain-containing protein [Apodospora peruviana]
MSPSASDGVTASTPLLQSDTASSLGPASPTSSSSPSLRSLSSSRRYERAAQKQRAMAASRNLSFASAVLSSLCAGSVTVFSLYGHIFQERLHYSQFQVNGVASAASIAMYIPVPLLGYICDRVGPAPLSLMSAVFFGGGYALAAGLYKRAAAASVPGVLGVGQHGDVGAGGRLAYAAMICAFVFIGVGTCAMYMSAVATCAKNFGRGKHRGLALAVPIAAFGLSGMWQSQIGSRIFYERLPDGTKGDVDVFRFFLFLSVLLFVVGLVGTLGLRIVDEQDIIDDAVEELERSGILDGSALFTPGRTERGYGAIEQGNPFEEDGAGILDPYKDPDDEEEEEARMKKQWVLNAETRRFLTDHTMWCFALGFFLMIGPGEAFINNLGTVIKTLYPPTLHFVGPPTSAATHVSIVGITSTVVRLLTGSLTDLLAPSPQAQHVQITSSALLSQQRQQRFSVSRVSFLLFFAGVLSLGLAALASGVIQNHGERFWIVSGLVGAGYGAVFSLTPIIITVIWGVENFATNWGIVAMFPALGATMWGLVYSAVYQAGVKRAIVPGEEEDNFCYGTTCYAASFWAMAASVWIACGLVLWAWKGRNGWAQRGIVV